MPQGQELDEETLKFVSQEVLREVEAGGFKLKQGSELTLQSLGDAKQNEMIKKLEKYIDLEAGGLKLLEIDLRGNPAQFLLIPSIEKKGVGVTLRFEYRF